MSDKNVFSVAYLPISVTWRSGLVNLKNLLIDYQTSNFEKCHEFERFQWKLAIKKLDAFPQGNTLFKSDNLPLLLLKNILLFIAVCPISRK